MRLSSVTALPPASSPFEFYWVFGGFVSLVLSMDRVPRSELAPLLNRGAFLCAPLGSGQKKSLPDALHVLEQSCYRARSVGRSMSSDV